MPSFSPTLEEAIHRALKLANDRRHGLATLEHLLLALLDDSDAELVLKACDADISELRRQLTQFIDEKLDALVSDDGTEEALNRTGFAGGSNS